MLNFSWKTLSLELETSFHLCHHHVYEHLWKQYAVSCCRIQFRVEPSNDVKLLPRIVLSAVGKDPCPTNTVSESSIGISLLFWNCWQGLKLKIKGTKFFHFYLNSTVQHCRILGLSTTSFIHKFMEGGFEEEEWSLDLKKKVFIAGGQ